MKVFVCWILPSFSHFQEYRYSCHPVILTFPKESLHLLWILLLCMSIITVGSILLSFPISVNTYSACMKMDDNINDGMQQPELEE